MYYMLFKLVRSNVYLTLYNKHAVNVLCEIETIVLSEFLNQAGWKMEILHVLNKFS